MNSEKTVLQALKIIAQVGICFMKDVPNKLGQVASIAERIGPIQETFYGRIWDVESVYNPKNIAYTELGLGLHMDLMYLESPPGLQLLHCLKNSVNGGESIFSDTFRAVELLSPQSKEQLQKYPVSFHYMNNGHHMQYSRPIISVTDVNFPLQISYSPPFQGTISIPQNEAEDFYMALREFEEAVNHNALVYQVKLQTNECVLFANRRILHGRRAFDAQTGERHLQGTYVSLDAMRDKHCILESRYSH